MERMRTRRRMVAAALAAVLAVVSIAATSALGAPVVKTSSKISIRENPVFHGRVTSSLRPCEKRRTVKLFLYKRHKPNKRIGRDRTNARGRWQVKAKLFGAYYAKVSRRQFEARGKTHVCRSARSPIVSYGMGT